MQKTFFFNLHIHQIIIWSHLNSRKTDSNCWINEKPLYLWAYIYIIYKSKKPKYFISQPVIWDARRSIWSLSCGFPTLLMFACTLFWKRKEVLVSGSSCSRKIEQGFSKNISLRLSYRKCVLERSCLSSKISVHKFFSVTTSILQAIDYPCCRWREVTARQPILNITATAA